MAYPTSAPVVRLDFSDGFKFYGPTTTVTPTATVNLSVPAVRHLGDNTELQDGQVLTKPLDNFQVPNPQAIGWATSAGSRVQGWSYDLAVTVSAPGNPTVLWSATIRPANGVETITPGMGVLTSGPASSGDEDTYPPLAEQHTYRLAPAHLPKWTTALDAVRAGTRDAKILIVGDSTSAGVGGNTASTSTFYSSWPNFMVGELDKLLAPTVNGLQVPGSISIGTDTRWTPASGWTKGADGAIGFANKGMHWRATPGSGSLTFKDNRILADRFDIYYMRIPGTADTVISATATGGTAVTQNVRDSGITAGDISKFTVSAATAATTNSVALRHAGATGNAIVVAVEPWLSTGPKRVRVGNAAASGTLSTTWAATYNATNAWATDGSIKAYAPDLTIIDLGVNDAHSTTNTTPETYRANIQKLIGWAAVSGDVILKSMIPSANDNPARIPNELAYVQQLRYLGKPMIDSFNQYGTYEQTSAAGLMADMLHGNATMYQREGVEIARVLAKTY